MLDIDGTGRGVGLKTVNDSYGHQAGDDLLRAIGELISGIVRRADVVARYGGDEFILLAPQTGKREAIALAKRIRKRLADTPFSIAGTKVHVTASFGAAVLCPARGESADKVVSLADQGVYRAKNRGGDQVCFVEADGQVFWPT